MNQQRTTVVIGGANGIGRAVANACRGRGDSVLVADIDSTWSGVSTCDVTSIQSVSTFAQQAKEALGVIDFVFHAAGVISSERTSLSTPLEHQRWVIDVNVLGTINVLNTFAPILMEQTNTSSLVITGSEHSVGVPHLGSAAYTASKHAVLGYADVLRRELPEHVHLGVLCPGIVNTSLWRSSERRQEAYGGPKDARIGSGAVMELGISPEQIADSVLSGVENREFLIMTHDHLAQYAAERYELIADATKRQVPHQGGKYETNRVIAEYFKQQQKS